MLIIDFDILILDLIERFILFFKEFSVLEIVFFIVWLRYLLVLCIWK